MSQKSQSILTQGRCWLIVVCIFWLAVPAFAEQKTATKNYQDTNGFYVVQFDYDDSLFSRPATMPEGSPHYDAKITVFRVVNGKTDRVCEPWRGQFTDGKCYEDNLADLVAHALKTANAKVSGAGTASAGLPGYTAGD
jgi:hypothetical protein